MLAPPLPPEPLPAPSEPPRAWSPEVPDPLDPEAPERDCSLFVDSRDWAIDHSFCENWERPGGRPPERSSSLLRHRFASRRRNGLLGTIRISCAYQSRRVLSCSPRAPARGDCISQGVYVPCGTTCALRVTEQAGTITSWPSSPIETPAAIPAGVSSCQPCQRRGAGSCCLSCLRFVWFISAVATGPPLLRFTGTAGIVLARRGEKVQRWYVTFHGGESSRQAPHDQAGSREAHSRSWNNIHVFALDGTPLGKALDTHTLPDDLDLRELRGFAFGPDGDLYVANAYKDTSQVLRFAGKPGADGKHPFLEAYSEQHKTNPGLAHPFDVAFGPDAHLYVPSQDTNIVARYYGPHATDGKPGMPMPHPEALQETDPKHLLPGTFIPAQKHAPRGLRTVRG